MLKNIKRELFEIRRKVLIAKGVADGRITPIDDEFYKETDKVIFNSVPITFHLKYMKPILPPGKCYDRSLFMFFCFPESLLCRGHHKDLELRFGKENDGHGWIEIGDYAYDPSSLCRFDKDLYYEIYGVTGVERTTSQEYNECTDGYYDKTRSVTLDDLLPGGKNRHSLLVDIPLSYGIAKFNSEFMKDMESWMETIQYDEDQITQQRDEEMRKLGFRF